LGFVSFFWLKSILSWWLAAPCSLHKQKPQYRRAFPGKNGGKSAPMLGFHPSIPLCSGTTASPAAGRAPPGRSFLAGIRVLTQLRACDIEIELHVGPRQRASLRRPHIGAAGKDDQPARRGAEEK
jgi:hypothetical protein